MQATPDDLRAFLSGTDVLRQAPPATVDAFASVCEQRDLSAGEVLFRQGDEGEFLFVVRAGSLDAVADGEQGDVLLRTLGPGEWGGLTSLTLNAPRSATLRAPGPTTVLTVNKANTARLLEQAEFSRAIIASLSTRIRKKSRRLADLLSPGAAERFRVAFFDTKPYERVCFEAGLGADLYFTWLTPRLDPHTAELARGHQAVCAFVNDDLGAETLTHLAQAGVSLVALRCAGFNNVDLKAAEALGVVVVRVPAYSPHAVAEHALSLLLTLNRKTHRAYNRVREGNFSLTGLVGRDLYGRTAGVIGAGIIGRCCAKILRGLGMRVLAYDVKPDLEWAKEAQVEFCDLSTLLSQSDVVSLHAPLMPATHHLINAERLALMPKGAFLINTSRGGLVDSQALIDVLKSGHLGGAGLDVYEEESEYFFEDHSDHIISDDLLARLLTFNNVLVTSHQGFLTQDALFNIAETTLQNIRQFASGSRVLRNRITP